MLHSTRLTLLAGLACLLLGQGCVVVGIIPIAAALGIGLGASQQGEEKEYEPEPTSPVVTGIWPASGPLAGGTSVQVFGLKFQSGASVSFNGTDGTNGTYISETEITCTTPAGTAGAADVVVTNPDAQSGTLAGGFAYVAAPDLVSINPTGGSAAGGTLVTLTGTGFQSGASITFDGTSGTNRTYISATSMTCQTPAHAAGAVNVVVTNPDTQSDTLANGFTYSTFPAPTLVSVNPTTGSDAGGTPVTVAGTGFLTGASVTFGGTSASGVTVASATSITCTTPAHAAGAVDVVVTNTDAQFGTLAGGFTYTGVPSWQATSTTNAPAARYTHKAVWTGREMIVWAGYTGGGNLNTGGKYDPIQDAWTATSTTSAPSARSWHGVVWTGRWMVVWGGNNSGSDYNTGGRYDPIGDSWLPTSTTSAPSARSFSVGVWTGREMIVWAGATCTLSAFYNDGARYDPQGDSWTAVNSTGAPSARSESEGVWTGSEMIAWGGLTSVSGTCVNDGGRYDPRANSWTALPAVSLAGRHGHRAVWTGREMIVWGGVDQSNYYGDGSRFEPVSATWTALPSAGAPSARVGFEAVWTGKEMIVWGGTTGATTYVNTGCAFDPLTSVWTSLPTTGAPAARANLGNPAVWTGREMVVWGGQDGSGSMNTGGRYTPPAPQNEGWVATSTINAPSGRLDHGLVWTGSRVIVWGGRVSSTSNNTGAVYNPEDNSWTTTSTASAPASRCGHAAVWTGREMIVWGGNLNMSATFYNTGGRYDPLTDSWTATSTTNAPTGRQNMVCVWTGRVMIVWAGQDAGGTCTDTGGRYDPVADTWAATTQTGSPGRRSSKPTGNAVWTGRAMAVWGGGDTNTSTFLNTGGLYDPWTDAWTSIPTSGAPSARNNHEMAWTGREVIVWGGTNGGTVFGDGGRFDPVSNAWAAVQTTGAPSARGIFASAWTGKEFIVWCGANSGVVYNTGGRYDPVNDAWSPLQVVGAPSERYFSQALWTGREMIVWGGMDVSGNAFNTGGRYQFDPVGTWTKMTTTGAPTGVSGFGRVWTGREMVVWGGNNGGNVNTGGRYDPITDAWTATQTTGAPSARAGHCSAWTGKVAVFWGGLSGTSPFTYENTGARYDPVADSWTATATSGAPTPRTLHSAVWTGKEMITWGGCVNSSVVTNTGGKYDPVQDTWSSTNQTGAPSARVTECPIIWTGREMIVWGQDNGIGSYYNTGAMYDPRTDSWTATSMAAVPSARGQQYGMVWTGREMIVWGGWDQTTYFSGVHRFDPRTNTWSSSNPAGEPSSRYRTSSIWTGREMFVWGGQNGSVFLNTGGRYDPVADAWGPLPVLGAPSPRKAPNTIWTGREMIAWGDFGTLGYLNTGARYEPPPQPYADTWRATSTTNAPTAAEDPASVWTGREMIVWGGRNASSPLSSGGRYDPISDSWTTTSTANAPSGRYGHGSVWTGREMIVWGGRDFGSYFDTGGKFDPVSDSWTSTATNGAPTARSVDPLVWTGKEMLVWGGFSGSYENSGGRYDPRTNTWSSMSTTSAPSARFYEFPVWAGKEMIIWGGHAGGSPFNTGGKYDPSSDSWGPVSVTGAPSARAAHGALWTGREVIIWGGNDGAATYFNTGGRYDPIADAWTTMSAGNAPAGRYDHPLGVVWTGKEMLVWGGMDSTNYYSTGGRYDLRSDTWSPMTTTGAPAGRMQHGTVWTGRELIVWGGKDGSGYLNTGGRYRP